MSFSVNSKVLRTFGISIVLIAILLLSACAPLAAPMPASGAQPEDAQVVLQAAPTAVEPTHTPFPTRPLYAPGELVDYVAQTGDTLPALAVRFNTTIAEILQANPFIPGSATTMPPGMPMKIPIYYKPLWGSSYLILPDSLFIDGPAQASFNTAEFVSSQPGWLNGYTSFAAGSNRTGAEIVDYVALRYSVSPRLLLALLEYNSGALSQPALAPEKAEYPLGFRLWDHKGLYLQLNWAANLLNNGYYSWRMFHMTQIVYPDGRLEVLDPWLNASTASLHNYFNQLYRSYNDYARAIAPEGLALVYKNLFGDPWQADQPHLPGSLVQPEFTLPFAPGVTWALTGGPHTAWGRGEPYAALDFAPGMKGCEPSGEWTTAIAPGRVVRIEEGVVVLDLDGDGDERTGWNIFYLHVAAEGRAPLGAELQRGDPVGHPSCEGGESTGTHVHIARKYNGEWIPAQGVLAFNLEGWIAHNGSQPYLGTLTRNNQEVRACTCSNQASFIEALIR